MSDAEQGFAIIGNQSFDWLFCFGMPKCGTTTLGALLALNPGLAVHNAKEPNDFITEPVEGLPRLSGYKMMESTIWLVDLSTQYGMPSYRDEVLDKMATLGLLNRARFVLCFREPEALARSYFEHLTTRSGLSAIKNSEEIRRRLHGAMDFVTVLDTLIARVTPEQIYVVKFEDLIGIEAQRRTIASLSEWLGVAPVVPTDVMKRNTAEQARSYPILLDALAGGIRQLDFVRFLSPQLRSRISRLLTRRVSRPTESFCPDVWTDTGLLLRSSEVYAALSTGPLPPSGLP